MLNVEKKGKKIYRPVINFEFILNTLNQFSLSLSNELFVHTIITYGK